MMGWKNCYLGTDFELHYPFVDTIIPQLVHTGPAAMIFKVDIKLFNIFVLILETLIFWD